MSGFLPISKEEAKKEGSQLAWGCPINAFKNISRTKISRFI